VRLRGHTGQGIADIAESLAQRLQGDTYVIPIIYVPMLMITHAVAFYWLVRPQSRTAQPLADKAAAS
jgi:hypothetical protein